MSMITDPADSGRRLTGRAVLFWLLGFFGIIFAVNFAFVYFAESTFPGVEVASSYAAGQAFEQEVAAGRAQAARGWTVDAKLAAAGPDATVQVHFADKAGADLHGLDVRVTLVHAVDPSHDHAATLAETGPGLYTATLAGVPSGDWDLTLEAYQGADRLFKSRNHTMLAR